ncbi:unnamed protein product [Chondrus crispus]|uniref:Signal recognition particle receptor subunit beta n=1 Tax=Chondrus crispus TaxID=2769 RepID=R7Q0G7_CHOCR|nr:unnamed protein product [Chondrus crispus]CDF32147.1 unnamed protein product [Chondrus crispus]|eukprot:XP_005711812.1 unnamed protein product [Chondrus crispus]
MVLEQYLGPIRPHVIHAAVALGNKMQAYGIEPPAHANLTDALVITVLVLTITVLGIALSTLLSRRDPRNAVLIVGISGDSDAPAVGKTALFKSLRYGTLPKHGTVPSMTVNDATFVPHGLSISAPPMRWIDFPGHPRLRHKMHAYLQMAKCIVFVVDGQRFTAQARKDTELLFTILTDPFIAEKGTPLLIFCNKSDVANPTKTVTVQTRLEAELERARASSVTTLRSAGVAVDGSGNQGALADEEERAQLGYENEPFSFDHAPGPVTFASGSAVNNDVEAIINFARSSFL